MSTWCKQAQHAWNTTVLASRRLKEEPDGPEHSQNCIGNKGRGQKKPQKNVPEVREEEADVKETACCSAQTQEFKQTGWRTGRGENSSGQIGVLNLHEPTIMYWSSFQSLFAIESDKRSNSLVWSPRSRFKRLPIFWHLKSVCPR